jgi:lactaldehyde reductase
MVNRMVWNQTAYFGRGAVAEIPGELARRGFAKALVVTDAVLMGNGVAAMVTSKLDAVRFPYSVFDEVVPNPTIETVQDGVAAFRSSGADCLIAIGGGSPQDTCKAIGIIATNPRFADVRSLEGVARTKNPSVPIIAVPTTGGTAAEATISYAITDTRSQRTFVCIDAHGIPLLAVVDADMMSAMPVDLKVATGMDALTHAIEGFVTKAAWELSDLLHLKAVEIIAQSLPASVAGDEAAAERMALGQYVAGMGFSNVGLGLAHGMAHPLSAFYGTPHGVASGILLPHVMAFNAEVTGDKFRDIARAMGVPGIDGMSLDEARESAVAAVAELAADLGVPSRLREVGVVEGDIPDLAAAALADVCTPGNPRHVTERDIEDLYTAVF